MGALDGQTVAEIIQKESKEHEIKQAKKSKWRGQVSGAAISLSKITLSLSSYIDPLIPQSPEYTVPYACLLIVFKV